MKAVILAGGMGTRISEYTKTIPKPMIKVSGKPILHRIIDHYIKYGVSEFYIALGYKGSVIKNYFKKKRFSKKIKVNLIDTGKKTMTGGRLKRLKKYLDQTFLMTYGDGLSNVNIKKLINFHKQNKKMITLTAVRPPARFGGIKLLGKKVKYFKEKSKLDEGWINGGFFVVEPEFLKLIGKKNVMLERLPMSLAVKTKSLAAYTHKGFWFCMDTLRDKKVLDSLIKNKKTPWLK